MTRFYHQGRKAAALKLGLLKLSTDNNAGGVGKGVGNVVAPPPAPKNPALKPQAAISKPMQIKAPSMPAQLPTAPQQPSVKTPTPPPAPPAMQPAVGSVWAGMGGSGGAKGIKLGGYFGTLSKPSTWFAQHGLLDPVNAWFANLAQRLESNAAQKALASMQPALKKAKPGPYANSVSVPMADGSTRIMRPSAVDADSALDSVLSQGMPKAAAAQILNKLQDGLTVGGHRLKTLQGDALNWANKPKGPTVSAAAPQKSVFTNYQMAGGQNINKVPSASNLVPGTQEVAGFRMNF